MTNKKSSDDKEENSDATDEDGFYHIELISPQKYKRFRTQNVGKDGNIVRVGGQRENGAWDTIKWLVGKQSAHVEDGRLVADDKDAQNLFDELNAAPEFIEGNRFKAENRHLSKINELEN